MSGPIHIYQGYWTWTTNIRLGCWVIAPREKIRMRYTGTKIMMELIEGAVSGRNRKDVFAQKIEHQARSMVWC
jgi:hypothetical protein